MTIDVLPLTPERRDDFLQFFDHRAWPPDHRWSGCYCYYDRFPGPADDWDPADAERNRPAMARLLELGMVRGWLAYDSDEPIGWLHATTRIELPHLKVPAPPPGRTERVGVLACFVVAPTHRRRGVARALLDAALDAFARQGLTAAEAYPPRAPRSEDSLYRGALAMYEAAGFERVGELEHHLIVRRPL